MALLILFGVPVPVGIFVLESEDEGFRDYVDLVGYL